MKTVTNNAKIKPNEGKLKELVLYVASKCQDDPAFGTIKCNKILFYADFAAFMKTGKPITGVDYVKLERGPAPRGIDRIIQELESAREAYVYPKTTPRGYRQKRLLGREAVLKEFSGEEIAIVQDVIEWVEGKTGKDLSDLTHRLPGWRLAKEGEVIPYNTAALPEEPLPLTTDEQKYGKQLAAKAGLLEA